MITSELPVITRTKSSTIRVLLIDPQSLMLTGLKAMLEMEADLQIVGAMSNAKNAIAQVRALQPDVVLMDSADGWTEIQQILNQLPSTKILALSNDDQGACILQAMQAGAKGYLLKNMLASELVRAIRSTHLGYSQMAPGLMEKLIGTFPVSIDVNCQLESKEVILTLKEREILRLISQGYTNREIAAHLFLAEGTIKTYVTRLLTRLSFRNRSQLAIYANSLASLRNN